MFRGESQVKSSIALALPNAPLSLFKALAATALRDVRPPLPPTPGPGTPDQVLRPGSIGEGKHVMVLRGVLLLRAAHAAATWTSPALLECAHATWSGRNRRGSPPMFCSDQHREDRVAAGRRIQVAVGETVTLLTIPTHPY